MSEDDKPIDIETQYPWGNKTVTYGIFVILFAINVIALSILFLAYIEIPFMQGENVFDLNFDIFAHAQVAPGDDTTAKLSPTGDEETDQQKAILYCLIVIAVNTLLVVILKVVGKWLNSIEISCRRKKCNWWCLCCNKWHCLLVWVLKWVTWVIAIVSTIITYILTWTCFYGVILLS